MPAHCVKPCSDFKTENTKIKIGKFERNLKTSQCHV